MKVKITTDSTGDLSPELLERYDIAVTPLTVTLGSRSGKDGTDITPDDIYAYVEQSGKLPKTSAVSTWEYEAFFRGWKEQGYEIVHFCISSEFSSSYQNAVLAAKEMDGVRVIDSRNLSTGQGLAVLHAAELAEAGCPAEEIARKCREILPRIEASFVVNDMEYLYKGGRCSGLAAFGANIFRIKPCIEVIDGHMEPRKKYRGSIQRAMRSYAEDRLKGRSDIDTRRIFLTHTRCDRETIEYVRSLIRELQPETEEILETTAGATITTHCGPETLGVLFVRK
ncbi:MAG: DegV family protein [Lachnospiraceae bacterium]|nr:DegV family protein [Lachnospiraceae bacterium]